jgi:post-segregation antitoxin (ccd killing protein)
MENGKWKMENGKWKIENCEAIDEVNCEAYHVSKPDGFSAANRKWNSFAAQGWVIH